MEIRNPFAINHFCTLFHAMAGGTSFLLSAFCFLLADFLSPHLGFLCFHTLTNVPICKLVVFITLQQYPGVGVPTTQQRLKFYLTLQTWPVSACPSATFRIALAEGILRPSVGTLGETPRNER
jgi:hypothetical protein